MNQVSGGIAIREWAASIMRNNVEPDRPDPTMKNGGGGAPASVAGFMEFSRTCFIRSDFGLISGDLDTAG